jgi:hypothetical protein
LAEISSLSTEYVLVPVQFTDPVTNLQIDPTGDTIVMAFTSGSTDPAGGDWVSATWRAGGPPYVAQTLVGPNGKTLAKGGWRVWVKITSNPELPVLRAGFLKVT